MIKGRFNILYKWYIGYPMIAIICKFIPQPKLLSVELSKAPKITCFIVLSGTG